MFILSLWKSSVTCEKGAQKQAQMVQREILIYLVDLFKKYCSKSLFLSSEKSSTPREKGAWKKA